MRGGNPWPSADWQSIRTLAEGRRASASGSFGKRIATVQWLGEHLAPLKECAKSIVRLSGGADGSRLVKTGARAQIVVATIVELLRYVRFEGV
jgi:hypothetical protein